jgi:phosphonate transport system permease protein
MLAPALVVIPVLGLLPGLVHGGGFDLLAEFIQAAFTPSLDPLVLGSALKGLGITVGVALLGWAASGLLGLALALASSRQVWASCCGQVWPANLLRRLLALPRSIHELLWGLLLLQVVGLQPAVAIAAIAIPYAALVARVLGDQLDALPSGSLAALRCSGVAAPQALLTALGPPLLPSLLSYGGYRLECALRSATLLGVFGLGGLGTELKLCLQSLQFHELWTGLWLLLAVMLLLETGLGGLRRRWLMPRRLGLGGPSSGEPGLAPRTVQGPGLGIALAQTAPAGAGLERSDLSGRDLSGSDPSRSDPLRPEPRASAPFPAESSRGARGLGWTRPKPSLGRRGREMVLALVVLAPLLVWLAGALGVQPLALLHWQPLPNLGAASWASVLSLPWAQLVGTTLLLTLVAAALAVGLAPLLLLVIAPWPGARPLLQLVWALARLWPPPLSALLLLLLLKPGLVTAALALGFHNLGVLGRLLLEASDDSPAPAELALQGAGVGPRLALLYGRFSGLARSYLAYGAYRADVILRESVVVGLVGAAGLGTQLLESLSSFAWDQLLALLVVYALLTLVGEDLSDRARRGLLGPA